MALKWFGKKKDKPAADSADSGPASPTADDTTAEQGGSADAPAASDDARAIEPASPGETEPKKKRGRFAAALKRGLSKTTKALKKALTFGRKLDDEALEEIESSLIQADFGPGLAMELTEALSDSYRDKEFSEEAVVPFLKGRLLDKLGEPQQIRWAKSGTTIILVTGVNGTGKTTSIAKLAKSFRDSGKSVLLAAGDTFRAAAVEQLKIWSERIDIEMVDGAQDADPAAVVFDALKRAAERQVDVLIIDTAGRLHTQVNLMKQLEKVHRVIKKHDENAPHEVLQVLDATTGQNAIRQAQEFKKSVDVTGLVLTKLDGTARGGVIFPILDGIGLPVKYIGVGEGLDDLQPFDPKSFVDALFDSGEGDDDG